MLAKVLRQREEILHLPSQSTILQTAAESAVMGIFEKSLKLVRNTCHGLQDTRAGEAEQLAIHSNVHGVPDLAAVEDKDFGLRAVFPFLELQATYEVLVCLQDEEPLVVKGPHTAWTHES